MNGNKLENANVVRFKSGLGNQMFQYALYKSLEHRGRNVKASLGFYQHRPDRSFSLTEVFPKINMKYISDEEFDQIDLEWKKIKKDPNKRLEFERDYRNRFFWVEPRTMPYQPEIYETQNCIFVGYWQTEKYFCDIRNDLLEDFEFNYGERRLEEWGMKISGSDQYVSVHIRRGDYLQQPEVWGNLSESNYYNKAISYMNSVLRNPKLVFFSDDIEWVKQNYKDNNAIYIEKEMFDQYRFWYDMRLMSCCSHHIIANSSFGWWGAWLNKNGNKIVIAPKPWFFDNERADVDICPKNWIRIAV